MANPKSLWGFICTAIDEVLPADSGLTGREVALRAWHRYEDAVAERGRAQRRRDLEKALPLYAELHDRTDPSR